MKVIFYEELLTKNQLDIYIAIKEYIEKHHQSPTMREIADITDTKCAGTVQKSMKILKRKGYIDYQDRKRRSVTILKKIKYKKKIMI